MPGHKMAATLYHLLHLWQSGALGETMLLDECFRPRSSFSWTLAKADRATKKNLLGSIQVQEAVWVEGESDTRCV